MRLGLRQGFGENADEVATRIAGGLGQNAIVGALQTSAIGARAGGSECRPYPNHKNGRRIELANSHFPACFHRSASSICDRFFCLLHTTTGKKSTGSI